MVNVVWWSYSSWGVHFPSYFLLRFVFINFSWENPLSASALGGESDKIKSISSRIFGRFSLSSLLITSQEALSPCLFMIMCLKVKVIYIQNVLVNQIKNYMWITFEQCYLTCCELLSLKVSTLFLLLQSSPQIPPRHYRNDKSNQQLPYLPKLQ